VRKKFGQNTDHDGNAGEIRPFIKNAKPEKSVLCPLKTKRIQEYRRNQPIFQPFKTKRIQEYRRKPEKAGETRVKWKSIAPHWNQTT